MVFTLLVDDREKMTHNADNSTKDSSATSGITCQKARGRRMGVKKITTPSNKQKK